jgi:hypothetical protein
MGQLACHTIAALFYAPVRIAAKSHYSSARVCRDTQLRWTVTLAAQSTKGKTPTPAWKLQDLEAGIKAYLDENGI